MAALDLERAHRTPIVPIRPLETLPGTLFTGFVDAAVRRSYVQIGRDRAAQVLDGMGWR